MSEAISLITRFFNGDMIGDPPNGYTKPSWTQQCVSPGDLADAARKIPLDEEEHEIMDPIMSELRVKRAELYTLFLLHYRFGMSDSKLSRTWITGLNKDEITAKRMAGEAWVEARLETTL